MRMVMLWLTTAVLTSRCSGQPFQTIRRSTVWEPWETTAVTVTFVVRDNCGNKTETTATFYALMGTGDLVQDEGPAILNEEVNGITLDQNRPNPFRDETVISFYLTEGYGRKT